MKHERLWTMRNKLGASEGRGVGREGGREDGRKGGWCVTYPLGGEDGLL